MEEIKTQKDLFNKLKPALRCKKHELMSAGINIVSENDIWEYNKNSKWKTIKGLTLYEVVDDILNTPNQVYEKYIINKLNIKEDVM